MYKRQILTRYRKPRVSVKLPCCCNSRGSASADGDTRSQARVQELEFLDTAVSSVSEIDRDEAKGERILGGLGDQVLRYALVYDVCALHVEPPCLLVDIQHT